MSTRIEISREHNSVRIYFDGKPDDSTRAALKAANIRPRKFAGSWYWAGVNTPWRLQEAKRITGIEEVVESDEEHIPFAERREREKERAERRADRREECAERRETEAAVRFDKGDLREEKSGIPFGQPILVGHHSEGRHRRTIERAHSHTRKAIELSGEAKELRDRAAASRRHQEFKEKPAVIKRRIDRLETDRRKYARNLERAESTEYQAAHGDEWARRLRAALAGVDEQLDYWRPLLEEKGGIKFNRDDFRPGDLVVVRGEEMVVARANPKTLSCKSRFMPRPLKYGYEDVQRNITAEERAASAAE